MSKTDVETRMLNQIYFSFLSNIKRFETFEKTQIINGTKYKFLEHPHKPMKTYELLHW
jgi:hypothetical protein